VLELPVSKAIKQNACALVLRQSWVGFGLVGVDRYDDYTTL